MKKLHLFSVVLYVLLSLSAFAQPSGWLYKQDLQITNETTVATTNYQVLVILNTEELIQAGKLRADGADLRFGKDKQGSVYFRHYVESGLNTTHTRIWVLLDEVAASSRKKFWMYYGNTGAVSENYSVHDLFEGVHSGTDSVQGGNSGGMFNSQRGFRFSPKQDIFVVDFGKYEPNGTVRTVTLFDHKTEEKLEQVAVSGAASQYSYAALPTGRWLYANKEYTIQIYQGSSDGYYFGAASQVGEHIKFVDMRFCNGCTENTYPTNSLTGMHYGYVDFRYLVRNNSIPLPAVEFGPFIELAPETLLNGKVNDAFSQQFTAVEGHAPYSFSVVDGFLPGGLSLSTAGVLSGTATAAGSYTFTVRATDANPDGAKYGESNYTLVIDKASQEITFAAPAAKTYGDAAFSLEASSDAGLTVQFEVIDGAAAVDGNQLTILGAGEVSVRAIQEGDKNYAAAEPVIKQFAVAKKKLTVAVKNESRVYGADDPEFSLSYKGLVNGDEYVKGIVIETSATRYAAVGEYTIVAQGTTANYEMSFTDGTLSILPKAITVAVNSESAVSKVYDGDTEVEIAAADFIIDGIENNDEVVISTSVAAFDNANAGKNKSISIADLQLGGEDKDNYKLVETSIVATGSINPKPVDLVLTSEPLTKTYDGSALDQLQLKHYTLEGVIEGDELTVTGMLQYNSKDVSAEATVEISELQLHGSASNNYVLAESTASANGIIVPKEITLGVKPGSFVKKVYDGNQIGSLNDVELELFDVVDGDEVGYVAGESAQFEDKHAGQEKLVRINELELNGKDAANYLLKTERIDAAIGEIIPKQISVKAIPQTKVYGAADPVFSYTATGKLEADELEGALIREEGKDVGVYVIGQGSLIGGKDYVIESFEGSELEITRAPLLITANNMSRAQGIANPEFKFTYTGLMHDDKAADLDAQPTASTNAAITSQMGYYDIIVSGAASPNYTISYAKGILTIAAPEKNKWFYVKAWSSSTNVLQVKVFNTKSQQTHFVLYNELGNQVYHVQDYLRAGINGIEIPINRLPAGIYILSVTTADRKDAQKLRLK